MRSYAIVLSEYAQTFSTWNTIMNIKAILLAATGVVLLAYEASADNVSYGSTRSNTRESIATPKDTGTGVKKDAKKGAISYGSTRSNTKQVAAPKDTGTGIKKKVEK